MFRKKIWSIIIIVAFIIFLFCGIRQNGKNNLQNNYLTEKNTLEKQFGIYENTIVYKGGRYQYRKDIVNILCIGVDKEEVMWERDDDGGSVGQADAILLVSFDFDKNKIRILAIPRDTMVSIIACDENGNEMGAFQGQLALQYAYADGQEKSCSLVIEQVSDILNNQVPINGCIAINLNCIGTVNDAVGGVTLLMDDDYTLFDPKFKKGDTVHLCGHEAQEYVQGRDITVSGSAYTRLNRQKQYLKAFITQAKMSLKNNPTLPLMLMNELSDYMLTDISSDEAVYLATEVLNCDFSEADMQILKGQIVMGDQYEEYYLDKDAVQQTILDLFYEEQN